jgi:hypothetical protein
MSRVIFTISYEIQADRRGEYLPLSQKIKDYIVQKGGVSDYSDESMQNFMALLEPMLIGGKMKYTTLVEV